MRGGGGGAKKKKKWVKHMDNVLKTIYRNFRTKLTIKIQSTLAEKENK